MKPEETKILTEEEEKIWVELCELIKYYTFENTLDEEFIKVASEHFQIQKK